MSRPAKKRFIVRKYVMASSAQEALRLEKRRAPVDVWIDDDWKKENQFEGRKEPMKGFEKPEKLSVSNLGDGTLGKIIDG